MKKPHFPKGSIMIWTLLMGISLAVVFFFFSQRLGAGLASQRATMEYQNARLLMESYADYLEHLPLATLETIKTTPTTSINFNGITGTLTNDVSEITGVVDAGATSPLYHFADTVAIQWNFCSQNFKTDMILVNGGVETPQLHHAPPSCPPSSANYDDIVASVAVSDPFSLKSSGAPFYYRITSTTSDKLVTGDKWQLDLEMPLGFRKKVSVSRTFTPAP
jgi:hypothetical protein